MKPIPLGRTIAGVLAGIFVIAGVHYLREAARIRKEFQQQSQMHPFDLPVDFSRPVSFAAEFRQTWQKCHGQAIQLVVPAPVLAKTTPAALRASLDFNWQIKDAEGRVVVDDKTSDPPAFVDEMVSGTVPLAYFPPFDIGYYTFNCTVAAGAPALAGADQRLVCQYQPCGIEMLAAVFCTGIGIAALVLAGLVALIVVAINRRNQRRNRPAPASGAKPSRPLAPPHA